MRASLLYFMAAVLTASILIPEAQAQEATDE